MPPRKRLNDRQITLLRRICAGNAPVTSSESTLAHTVYALRRQGLVTTTWDNGQWTAHPTPAGHAHLHTGDEPPNNPPPQEDTDTLPRSPTNPSDLAAHLLAQLQQNGGTLHFTNPPPQRRAELRRALHAAKTRQLLPEGHHLLFTGRDHGDLTIHLRTGGHPVQAAPRRAPVPVDPDLPEDQLHPAAREAPLPVCPDCRPRARRILHALAHAAHHSGFTLTAAAPNAETSVEITARETTFCLQFTEGRTEEYDTEGVQYPWQRVTERTTRPSHQLDLSLPHSWGNQGRRYRWGDRQRWHLEDKLPQILDEITQRARREEEQRLARQRHEEETHRRWREAKEQARRDLIHTHRLKTLQGQTEAWHEATRIRAYCDALEQHLLHAPAEHAEDDRASAAWIAWARDHAARLDPLPRRPRTPENPEITPEALRPYLRGWSPYEPKR